MCDLIVPNETELEVLTGQKLGGLAEVGAAARLFSVSAMERRRRMDHPSFGALWVSSLEDLILAKLEWAKLGASARQLEDVRTLLRLRGEDVDTAYIERWLDALGIRSLWTAVSTSVP